MTSASIRRSLLPQHELLREYIRYRMYESRDEGRKRGSRRRNPRRRARKEGEGYATCRCRPGQGRNVLSEAEQMLLTQR